MDRVADIFAGITAVAMVTTIVAHKNTSKVIAAGGKAYANALGAAMSVQ
jgi:hypothetical protein